jgi:inorganic triphosphatase YgiF
LAIPATQVDAVRALMTQIDGPAAQHDLETLYLDTPDFALHARGVSVRLRRRGSIWVQSIKSDGLRRGGLSSRREWEVAVPRGDLNLQWELFPKAARKHIPPSLRIRCRHAFTTHVHRTSWLIKTNREPTIEVALDVGTVQAGRRYEPVCEMELELKSGTADGLTVWVEQHLQTISFWPLDDSKSKRGVRLAQGKPPSAAALDRRSFAITLDARLPLAQAWVTVGRACLAHFQTSLARWHLTAEDEPAQSPPTQSPSPRRKPKTTEDPRVEWVHQARVALRRLRGAMRLFRDHHTIDADLEQSLRTMAQALGAARDWDVFCDQTLPPMASAWNDAVSWGLLAARAESRRAKARTELRRTLDDLKAGAWLLAMHQTLNQQEKQAAAQPAKKNPPRLDDWIQQVLHRGHRKLSRGIKHWSQLTLLERHALRITIKRQRYAVEFFQSRLSARHTRRYLAALIEAQEVLGQTNDLAVARSLLPRLTDETSHHQTAMASSVSFAQGWLAAKTQDESTELKPKTKSVLKASSLPI